MVHILSRPLKEVRRRLPGLPLPAWFPPFVVFVLAAIAFTWPLARNLTSQKPYLGSDPILIHAILEWERFALFNDLLSFFDGNFYYLTPGALFFGDLLLGSLPLYLMAASILGPDGGFNVVYLSLFVFNGAAMYMLLLRITSNRWASLLGGVIFAFAPVQQFYISNYQMLMSWWTPLMLWFLLGALERRPTRNFAGATLVLLLQFATSIYWGFFALWTFLLFMVVALVWGRFRGGRARALRSLAMGGLPVAVVFLPIGFGYFRFFLEWKSSRGIDHVVYLSATLPNYFEAAYGREWLRAWKSIDFAVLRPYLISGVSGLVFAGAGVASAVTRSRRRPIIAVAALVTLTAFLFSLGPVFKWHGEPTDVSLPYQFAYDHLPGLQSLRAVERWVLASHFGLSVLAGIGSAALWHLLRRFGPWRVLLAVGVAAAVALDFGRPSVPQREYPQEIELKRVLRTLPRDPAIVVPMVDNLEIKSNYMSWSAESSALPLLNGYNGWVPPTQEHLARLVNGVNLSETPRVYAALHALGVRTVILDPHHMQPGSYDAWTQALADVPDGGSRLDVERFAVLRLAGQEAAAPISTWDAITGELFISSLRAGASLTAPLILVNGNPAPWLSPVSQGTRPLDVRWEPESGGAPVIESSQFQSPPVIAAMGTVTLLIRLAAPESPGVYRLAVSFEGNRLATAVVTVRSGAVDDPAPALAAEIRLLDVSRVIRAGETVRLTASATNLGSEAWDGDVRLGYKWWFRGDSARPTDFGQNEGRLFLDLDRGSRWEPVPPGSAYTFSGPIRTPERVGRYSLVLGMVKEGVAWFAEELLDVHVVDRDASTAVPAVEQVALEEDFVRGWNGETYQIASGRRRLVSVAESLEGLPLVDRRLRLVSDLELELIPEARGSGS